MTSTPPARRRAAAALFAVAVLASACQDDGDDDTSPASADDGVDGAQDDADGAASTAEDAAAAGGDATGPVAAPVRSPATARPIYFVMPDRFANGDPGNDRGGLDSTDALVTGYLPADIGFHQGGDLAGLVERLDYLDGLGVGALWITPPFTNRFVQGDGTVEGSSSSYHGYWQVDWTRVDPHLGTDDDLRTLVDEAHARDIDVYLDVVVNHTGDVIRLADNPVYVATSSEPYVDAEGEPFDLAAVVGSDAFPTLDAATSFPYEPTFATPEDAEAKAPAWLNDVTLYHNRGDSTFQGESSLLGDFFGLDDLFTGSPRVIEGMTQLHGDIAVTFGVDGFRVDTMKHVGDELWATFLPAVQEAAAAAGEEDFFVFGEVFNNDPISQSAYTNLGADGTLDFMVASGLEAYVTSGDPRQLVEAFDGDDWFTDADNNASTQVTFFGNHDVGRMGHLIDRGSPGADEDELLARMRLGFDLLFTVRGVPVVYYGDEQGFTGDGGDKLARATMFPAIATEYVDDDNIGSDATPADDNFDADHPLYRHVAALAAARAEVPALVTGAMLVHEVDADGVFAFSRVDREDRVEVVVATNAGTEPVTAAIPTLSPDTAFTALPAFPTRAGELTSAADGTLEVSVPALATVVLLAETPLPLPSTPTDVVLVRPDPGTEIPTRRYRIEAELGDRRYAEVTFAASVDGGEPVVVGVDDAPPYRVYWNNADLPDGAEVELLATVEDGSGQPATARVDVTLGVRDR